MKRIKTLLVSLLVLVGCNSNSSIKALSVSELQLMLESNKAQYIDVRTPEEYEEDHISEFINIPLIELPERLNELNKTEPVVLICRSGRRSAEAADILKENGFEIIYDVKGGMNAWNDLVKKK